MTSDGQGSPLGARRLALVLEYDGTRYHGFQVQPGAPTVQGEVERVLELVAGHRVRVQGAGRTDAGAHARGQVVAFWTRSRHPAEVFSRALNATLPEDIRVRASREVDPAFDPRRNALSRVYRYLVYNRPEPSALWGRYSHHVARPLDVDAMGRAARWLEGRHDFRAFVGGALGPGASTVRRVLGAGVWRKGHLVTVEMEGEAFLPQQVRRTVAALVRVGMGRLGEDTFRRLVDGKEMALAGPGLPPKGLVLMRVRYPEGTFEQAAPEERRPGAERYPDGRPPERERTLWWP